MSAPSPDVLKLQDFVVFARSRPENFPFISVCLEILYWILLPSFLLITVVYVLENGLLVLLSIRYAVFFAIVETIGRRRKRFRVNPPELLKETSLMPVLYLRSFYYESADREVPIGPFGQKEKWYEKENDDEVLAFALRNVSQLIAVGSHSDKLPPLGAVRLYFKDDEWQEKIKQLISIAQIVIIQPGYTIGTDWEINTLKEMNIPPEKIIFSFLAWQHLSKSDREIQYGDFAMQIKRIYGLQLPDHIKNSYFLYLDQDWQPHLVGLRGWKAVFFWLSSRPSLLWRVITFKFPSFGFPDWNQKFLRRLPTPRVFRRYSVPSVREAIRPILKQRGVKLPIRRTASYVMAWIGAVIFFSLVIGGGGIKMINIPPPPSIAVSQPIPSTADWPLQPLVAGDWTTVDNQASQELRSRLMQNAPPQWREAARNITQFRTKQLTCYSGAKLCEGLVPRAGSSEAGILTCILIRDGAMTLLSGKSSTIHDLNKSVPIKLNTQEYAEDYLRFFCAAITAELGNFHIFERVEDLAWERDAPESKKQQVAKGIKPLVIERLDDGRWKASATIQYGPSVFNATLYLDITGNVDMTDDLAIASNLPLQQESFNGPLRYRHGPKK